ncbi:hypothetical protein Tco_1062852 [Tanacetum coccineum]
MLLGEPRPNAPCGAVMANAKRSDRLYGGGVDGGGGSGGSGVVDVCGGDDGDVVWCGVMMVTVVAAGGMEARGASGFMGIGISAS